MTEKKTNLDDGLLKTIKIYNISLKPDGNCKAVLRFTDAYDTKDKKQIEISFSIDQENNHNSTFYVLNTQVTAKNSKGESIQQYKHVRVPITTACVSLIHASHNLLSPQALGADVLKRYVISLLPYVGLIYSLRSNNVSHNDYLMKMMSHKNIINTASKVRESLLQKNSPILPEEYQDKLKQLVVEPFEKFVDESNQNAVGFSIGALPDDNILNDINENVERSNGSVYLSFQDMVEQGLITAGPKMGYKYNACTLFLHSSCGMNFP